MGDHNYGCIGAPADWDKTQSSDLTFAVQTGQKEKADLEANLVKLGASSESHQAKIADLAGSAATTEAELKAATAIRAKEHADFEQSEKELLDVIDTLERAIVIIEKEMKGGASMMQLQRAGSVIDVLNVMVQASSINSADATKLTALEQNSQNSDDADDIVAAGAPAATVYKSHSGFIVETLEDLKSLTETQGQLTTDTADLKMTKDTLAEDTAALEITKQDCQAKAAEFEAATNSRSEELEALAKARAVISEKTGGAESFSNGLTQTSFLVTNEIRIAEQEVKEPNDQMEQVQDEKANLTQALAELEHNTDEFSQRDIAQQELEQESYEEADTSFTSEQRPVKRYWCAYQYVRIKS